MARRSWKSDRGVAGEDDALSVIISFFVLA